MAHSQKWRYWCSHCRLHVSHQSCAFFFTIFCYWENYLVFGVWCLQTGPDCLVGLGSICSDGFLRVLVPKTRMVRYLWEMLAPNICFFCRNF
jgi:hypothetical protein